MGVIAELLLAWLLLAFKAVVARTLVQAQQHPPGVFNFTVKEADVPDRCVSERPADRLVVAAKHKEDVEWLSTKMQLPFMVYQVDTGQGVDRLHRIRRNKGNEAEAYLHFIAEYYNCLPKVTAFIHAHESSWHTPNMQQLLDNLQWYKVDGYLPLDRKFFKPYGSFFSRNLANPEKHLTTVVASGEEALNGSYSKFKIVNGSIYDAMQTWNYHHVLEVHRAWEHLFDPAGMGPMPDLVTYYCCAQFAVSRERIQKHPREFYLKAIDWMDNMNHFKYIQLPFMKGLVWETLWHYVLGEPAILTYHGKAESDFFEIASNM